MIGCYDFCGHYEWTFSWLEREGGIDLLRAYWDEAISQDSQRHARDLIAQEGFAGMAKYWGHTLVEESPDLGFSITWRPEVFRIDIHDCPSKGFLIRNALEQHHDYCDHCIGWIGPTMAANGFVIDHEHNHRGQCWWEFHPARSAEVTNARDGVTGARDVRRLSGWRPPGVRIDAYRNATDPGAKLD